MGPDAMRIAAYKVSKEFFELHPTQRLRDFNEWLYKPIVHEWAKRIEGVSKVYDAIIPELRSIVTRDDRFLVILAAAHGTAGASIKAIKSAYPEKRLGVVWIDAHGDLHSPYTTPSGNMHGMPLAIAMQKDNYEHRRRDLPPETVDRWEKLKRIGYDAPAIDPRDLLLVAARDLEVQERYLVDELGIRNFPVRRFREEGSHVIAREALEALQDCDHIYVTFDVDSLDTSISVGTGTPVPGGLIASEAKGLLRELVRNPRVQYLEVVEINPTLDDKGNVMAEVSFEILRDVVDVIESER